MQGLRDYIKKHGAWNKGITHSIEHRKNLSKALIGRKLPAITRKRMSDSRRGSNNPFWKGGATAAGALIRSSHKYAEWRKSVFERDDYICQSCYIRGGVLHAHHVMPFSKFPEVRFSLKNGLTLHKKCHHALHSRMALFAKSI